MIQRFSVSLSISSGLSLGSCSVPCACGRHIEWKSPGITRISGPDESQRRFPDDDLRHRRAGCCHRFPGRSPPKDGPGTVDGWGPRLRRCAYVFADGRRSVHHVLLSRSQRLGLFPWRPNLIHHGLPDPGLCCLVLHPAADLGGRPEVWNADPIRFLQPAIRQQVSGRICVCRWYRLLYPLPAAPDNRTGHYRLDRQLRWHRPYTSHDDVRHPVSGFRSCQRRSGGGLGQCFERCVDGLRGGHHWHRNTLYPFWRDRPHVRRLGA